MSDSADPAETAASVGSAFLAMVTVAFALSMAFVGVWAALLAVLSMTVVGGVVFGAVYWFADSVPGETRDDVAETGRSDDALDRLRERYARGELSEEAFERKLDVLLATETEEKAGQRIDETSQSAPRDREFERSSD